MQFFFLIGTSFHISVLPDVPHSYTSRDSVDSRYFAIYHVEQYIEQYMLLSLSDTGTPNKQQVKSLSPMAYDRF